MAKRSDETKRGNGSPATDALERQVVAFGEQLGRMAGTFQRKADGWLDRQALMKQVATVRDSASELLEHLARGATKAAKTKAATATLRNSEGRSGGVVDAPGKRHRKPMPTDPSANLADSQADKMRMAKTMVKTHRRRGRA